MDSHPGEIAPISHDRNRVIKVVNRTLPRVACIITSMFCIELLLEISCLALYINCLPLETFSLLQSIDSTLVATLFFITRKNIGRH